MLSERRKLLLADDSPTIQKVISLTFGDEGMEVVAVGDGARALRALEDEPPPDVVLADVVMPGPDGYELCERVKRDARLRHVPVVLLVGTFEPFNEAEARRVGADTVLTKPFQSIRDLVSKVGSLLGGESKHEEETGAAREESAHAHEPAEAPPAARAEAPVQQAQGGAAFDAHAGSTQADPSSSFADLGADDELIEVRPADAFGAAASVHSSPPPAAHAFAGPQEPDPLAVPLSDADAGPLFEADAGPLSDAYAGSPSEANGNAAGPAAAFDADWGGAEFTSPQGGEGEASRPAAEEIVTSQTDERKMHEETSPQPSFNTRAASAAAADDALLDLGQIDAPAVAPAAEADDFVLDLGFEDEPAPAAVRAAAPESPAYEVQAATAPAWADAPSAFAEAAHGEQPLSFPEPAAAFDERTSSYDQSTPSYDQSTSSYGQSASSYDQSTSSYDQSVPSFDERAASFDERTPSYDERSRSFDERAASLDESAASFGESSSSSFVPAAPATAETQGEPWRDVVLQDGPQGFAFGAEPQGSAESQGVGAAPRGFVEPEVVPADEPVPAVFESRFTDGSVEGDVPKVPFDHAASGPAGSTAEAAHEAPAPQAVAHGAASPQDLPAAGYRVGEARAGLEEPLRADQLSREAIDAIARRVVEMMSDKVVREIAWEVVPELAELLIKQRLEEERQR